jgi:hypothetical protein
MTTKVFGNNGGDDYTGTADTQIHEASATTNYGTDTTGEVTKYGAGDWTRVLLKFTGITNIPAGSNVTAVTIDFYHDAAGQDTSAHTFSFYKLSRAWVEGQATWNQYSSGNNWATAGGMGTGDAAASASASVARGGGGGSSYGAYLTVASTSQLVADVQSWVDGTTNNGWIVDRTDASNDSTYSIFDMHEGTDGQRPKLTVTYSAPNVALSGSAVTGGSGTQTPSITVTL